MRERYLFLEEVTKDTTDCIGEQLRLICPFSNHRVHPCLMLLLNTTHRVVATLIGALEKRGDGNGRVRAFPGNPFCFKLLRDSPSSGLEWSYQYTPSAIVVPLRFLQTQHDSIVSQMTSTH